MTAEAPTFDEIIHAPQRLRICAMLSAAHQVEFGLLQERLGLSKSALSKHLSHLTEAGYLRQSRVTRDSRSRLWLSLTPAGARACRPRTGAATDCVGRRELILEQNTPG